MRKLYQKIYLTIVVSLLLVVAIAGAFWRAGFESSPAGQAFELAGELAAAALPPADAPAAVQRQAVERLAMRLDMNLALYAADRTLIARAGRPLPGPPWPESLPERPGHPARASVHSASNASLEIARIGPPPWLVRTLYHTRGDSWLGAGAPRRPSAPLS